MPTNKNAIVRYKIIDDILSDCHHYYDINDITRVVNERLVDGGYLEVTRRCIEKDLNFLESAPFYADIERTRINGKNRIHYSNVNYSIFNKELTAEEETLLGEVLNTLGQFDGIINFDKLEKLRLSLGLKDRPKIISFSSNEYLKNSNMLGCMFSFIANSQVVKVTYHTFQDLTRKNVEIYPYLLKQYNDRWFLIGADRRDGYILNFALDRIDGCEPVPELPYKPYDGDIFERFEDIVGVTLPKGLDSTRIVLWVDDGQLPYIITKPIHGSQKIVNPKETEMLRKENPHLNGGTYIALDCIVNTELKQKLFSFMDSVVVISPLELVVDMKKKIRKLADNYG